MENILKVLKELRVSEYRLVEKTIHAKEWFFIRKQIDLTRAKEVKNYYLTIYQPIYLLQERFKGKASVKLTGQEDHEQLVDIISQLVKEANYVKNPYFELPSPKDVEEGSVSLLGNVQDIFEMMKDFYESEDLSLNSFELFEEVEEMRIVNSKGIDVYYMRPSHELELVINAKDSQHEVEIYQDLKFGSPSVTELKHRIGEACRQAEERKKAIPTSKMETCRRIIISKENVLQLMQYYLAQLNVANIYRQYSNIEIGDEMGPEGFHLEGLPYLESSSRNRPYDDDGRPVLSTVLIEQGQVHQVWGAHEPSSYLGLNDTTMVYNYKVGSGKMSVQEMKAQPYLELVQFSSFSCNPLTGDFAGEIRLGYYFDGEKTTPITQGSISGNVKVNEPTMVLSKELEKYDYAVVPQAVLLDRVTISV